MPLDHFHFSAFTLLDVRHLARILCHLAAATSVVAVQSITGDSFNSFGARFEPPLEPRYLPGQSLSVPNGPGELTTGGPAIATGAPLPPGGPFEQTLFPARIPESIRREISSIRPGGVDFVSY